MMYNGDPTEIQEYVQLKMQYTILRTEPYGNVSYLSLTYNVLHVWQIQDPSLNKLNLLYEFSVNYGITSSPACAIIKI